jgi:hypothetical protein
LALFLLDAEEAFSFPQHSLGVEARGARRGRRRPLNLPWATLATAGIGLPRGDRRSTDCLFVLCLIVRVYSSPLFIRSRGTKPWKLFFSLISLFI